MDILICIVAIVVGYLVIATLGYESIRAVFYEVAFIGYFILRRLEQIKKILKEKENANE